MNRAKSLHKRELGDFDHSNNTKNDVEPVIDNCANFEKQV
jgi:hypothetical protein